jgi:NOL1/NOP2/sun family putative RNA methylase
MQIPEKLLERLKKLGLDETIYGQRTRKAILSRSPLPMERVPWYEHAYIIDDNFDRKNLFVFDPVSLVPCIALGAGKEDKILDMCAAPGTKTFILSFLTNNEAHITANDISRYRVMRLSANVNKFNLSCIITNSSGRKIREKFNKILIDAPCSGEGMVNKKEKVFEHWSEKRVKVFSKKQKKLAMHGFEILEDGGTLVYSTCTFEPEENELVVNALLDKYENAKIDDIDVAIRHDSGIAEWNRKKLDESIRKCIRIYPQHNNTSGFFVAKIRKLPIKT